MHIAGKIQNFILQYGYLRLKKIQIFCHNENLSNQGHYWRHIDYVYVMDRCWFDALVVVLMAAEQ